MTREQDFIRLVEAYLDEHEGNTPLPDAARDAIRAELPLTNQRPAWWPTRRFPEMNATAKLVAAAAAVVVAAFLGFNYLIAPNVGGPGIDDPAPTPGPTPAALRSGPLDPGRYAIDNPRQTPVRFAVTVPAGWTARASDSSLSKHANQPREVGFSSYVVTHVYADACEPGAPLTEIGPTVDDLVNALQEQTASEASTQEGLTIGGYAAVRVEMTAEANLDAASCRLPDGLQIWADPGESDFLVIAADASASVYIVQVEGERVVIGAGGNADSSAADLAELDAMIDSITFEP